MGGSRMKLTTLHLPERYIKALDQLVADKMFANRADAIRLSIRDLLISQNRFTVQITPEYTPPQVEQIHSRKSKRGKGEKLK
jgi:Arc/MetJ-type ribon-helix-helix transcriptional regulator